MGKDRRFDMRGMKWRDLTLPLCLVLSAAACADSGNEFDELPVVLTASRMHQPLAEAPAAVTVIDREMIERSGVRQIADLLRFVPGAIVGYNDGNWPVATLRGLSSTYASGLQVLIDGVSVYSPVFGGMFWAELPLSINDIERIEVVRGPNAASYGANAFQGVVNIITRDPLTESGTQILANAGATHIRDATVRHAGKGESWNYRVTLGQRSDEGFLTRPDSQRFSYANLKTEYRVNALDHFDLSLRWAGNNKDIGIFEKTDPTFQAHKQTGDRVEFQGRWSHAESADDEWWIQFYHHQVRQLDRMPLDVRDVLAPLNAWPTPLPFEMEQDYATWRDGIEMQTSKRWSDYLRTVAGAEFRRDSARSGRLLGTDEEISTFLGRAFGNFEWRMADQWILHSGAMFERNTLASSGWSPRLALVHEVAHGHALRASVSSARRTPNLIEEKGNYGFIIPIPVPPFNVPVPLIAASGKVDSEKVHSKELGYVFSLPQVSLNGDLRWFSDRYSGLITYLGKINFVVGGDAVNLDDAKTTGVDLTLQWQPQDGTHVRLAAAHTSTTSHDIGGKYSTSVPRDTLSLLLSQEFSAGWVASANYQRVGEMFWTDAGQSQKSMPAIDHLNLKLARKFKWATQEMELAGVVQNALGHYRDYYLGPSFGTPNNVAKRLAFLQLTLAY